MTREELKRHCLKQVENCEIWAKHHGEEPHGKIYEEHKLILELLAQEPCEDCVSREAVIDLIADYDLNMDQVVKAIHALPSVAPQPKTGHWIDMVAILDKIKAEIEALTDGAKPERIWNVDALAIINKYKAENKIEQDNKNLCDSCITKGCIFQSGIVRSHCDFYKAESEE